MAKSSTTSGHLNIGLSFVFKFSDVPSTSDLKCTLPSWWRHLVAKNGTMSGHLDIWSSFGQADIQQDVHPAVQSSGQEGY